MTLDALVPPADRDRDASGLDYAGRLAARARSVRSCLCVGIDPTPDAIQLLDTRSPGSRQLRAGAIERFCGFVTEAARDRGLAVKLQVAWFELAGPAGMRALARSVEYARTAGLPVILDAKRGDVPHSADAYARAWLGRDAESGCGGDAMTVNVSLGADVLSAFTEVARARKAQVYALVHTSNPGAAGLQGVSVRAPGAAGRAAGEDAPAEAWWHLVARMVEAAGAGAVVGATQPGVLAQARRLMPTTPLLVPGVGAQGGSIDQLSALAAASAPPTLVSVSRGLLPPDARSGADFRNHVAASAAKLADATMHLHPAAGGT